MSAAHWNGVALVVLVLVAVGLRRVRQALRAHRELLRLARVRLQLEQDR